MFDIGVERDESRVSFLLALDVDHSLNLTRRFVHSHLFDVGVRVRLDLLIDGTQLVLELLGCVCNQSAIRMQGTIMKKITIINYNKI